MIQYLCVIQARLFSTRFPGKVMQLVNGRTMVKRVWDAAIKSYADRVVVAWPERFPEIAENDLYSKFCILIQEFKPRYIIRLTADCPLISTNDINEGIRSFELGRKKLPAMHYYNNRKDGFDVQIFTPEYMYAHPSQEHVIEDIPNTGGLSVNTPAELEKVRRYAR